MMKWETKIRVRYGETDQMGYVYHGAYPQYYEVGRVEAIRELGFSYKEVEERGFLMPVIELNIQYKKPAFYDDELTIYTIMNEMPTGLRLPFEYECYNQKGELLNKGKVTLVCIDKQSGKMTGLPDWFKTALEKHF
jgi:acyl-CoA thioester hydrolase